MTDVELFIIIGSIITLILFAFIISFLFINQRRHFNYLKEKQTQQTQFQQTLLKSQLEIQEQTLKNVSLELHDNVGQVLSLVKLNINTMSAATKEKLNEKINESRELISKAIQDLRDLSRSINTDYVMDTGLINLIEHELDVLKKAGNYDTNLTIDGNPRSLEKQKELILFRIVQEVFHNIIKHAKATTIDVRIMFEPGVFSLTIIDNGIGFDAKQLELKKSEDFGLGIRSMHNRANLINSEFKLISSVGKGTNVILTMPYRSD
ncbi:MAG: ATP-binding protein [Bacteroidota bacterium]|nr:ATP-binding protein [Bacteroidota bacterium]